MATSEAELRQRFDDDPASAEAFIAIRRYYQSKRQFADLAEVYERRADALDEPTKEAELLGRAADILLEKLKDDEAATRCLMRAVQRDASQRRPMQRLKGLLKDKGQWKDYLQVLELESGAMGQDPRQARNLAKLHLEMGTLWEEHFADAGKAMYHYQQSCRFDNKLVPALQAARRAYRQTGDWPAVVRFMEMELGATSGAKARFELLLSMAQIHSERLHNLADAARCLEDALAARPGDLHALEALGNLYANPEWQDPDGAAQASKVFLQLGQIHRAARNEGEAVIALKRALTCDPRNRDALRLLERAYQQRGDREELEHLYAQQLESATGKDRATLLARRGALLVDLGRTDEAKACYEELARAEPPGGPASEMLAGLYLELGQHAELVALKERTLEVIDDAAQRINVLMELAVLYRDKLEDEDKAGYYLHGVLQMDPNHPQALEYYREHFRAKGDYRGLADLIAFAIEGAIENRSRRSTIVTQLKELANICERRLGDLPRAADAWRRIQEIDPTNIDAPGALQKLAQKEHMWQTIVAGLQHEIQAAQTREQHIDALLRLGQAHLDRNIDPVRGIEILEELLQSAPGHPDGLSLLAALYQRDNNWEGLASVYRRQLDIARGPGEQVPILRELGGIYHERLKAFREAGWACKELLKLVPGDEEALGRLIEVLQALEDWPKLIRTLRYHAKGTTDPSDRAVTFRRIARLSIDKLEDFAAAADAWQEVYRLFPQDQEALRELTALYEQIGQWERLADLLEDSAKALADDDEVYQAQLRRLARVADTRLRDPDRALEAWRSVSEMMPEDQEALAALARLYYTQEDFDNLAEVITRQIPLTGDPSKAASLSFRLADIYTNQLELPQEAIAALENVLELYDPGNVEALTRLRALFRNIGEPARAVEIAEKQLPLLDGEPRTALALEIATAWRDDVGDEAAALEAFERVREMDATNIDALSALASLYTRAGRWESLIETNEVLFDFADNEKERLGLLYQSAEVYEQQLDDPNAAFRLYRKAFALYPEDRSTLTSLARCAAQHNLWEELIDVYEQMRARAQTPEDHLEAAIRIAGICEDKIDDAPRAFDVLRGALVVDLAGREVLPELERLAPLTENWDRLVEAYERVLKHRRETSAKLDILHKCATVLEEHLGDTKGALQRMRRAFDMAPQHEETQEWLLRLAEDQESWDDVLAVYGAQYNAAPTLEEKLDVIRLSAPLVEQRVGDKVKSFRAWIKGFLMFPEDREVLAEVWRLAQEIGSYSEEMLEADVEARRQRRAAQVAQERAARRAASPGPRLKMSSDRPDVTMEIDITELEFVDDELDDPGRFQARTDPTQELSLSDLLDIQQTREGRSDVTVELSLTDLIDMEHGASSNLVITRPRAEIPHGIVTLDLPEDATNPRAEAPGGADGEGAGADELSPPTSAWEELARAYAMLPQPDLPSRLDICHHVAKVWREGAGDLERTFVALRRGLELDPMDLRTRDALSEVAEEMGAQERLGDIYVEILESSHGSERIVALNREAAQLYMAAPNLNKAEERYLEVLIVIPDDPDSFEQLQAIYKAQERWSELAQLKERQMDDLVDQMPAGPERQAKLRELAKLYEEKLDQPYEAMSVLQKLIAELPGDLDSWRSIARLAIKTASWSKAVEALGRVADDTDDPDGEGMELLWRIAEIYRDELELPDRAIDAFRNISERDPRDDKALAALQQLYRLHEQWEDLQDVLAQRAEMAGGEIWSELTAERAAVLEKHLDSPSDAADCFLVLRRQRPDDDQLLGESVRLLRVARRSDEAVDLLRERIERAEKKARRGGEIAALLVRLASIESQDLGDLEAARAALDRALEMVPEYPSALAELARLHKTGEDWEGYAAARLREAEAAKDPETTATALLEAAKVFVERLSQPDQARECYDRVLKRNPKHAPALEGLAELEVAEHNWAGAIAAHQRRFKLVDEPREQAQILATIGELTRTGLGQRADAAAHYRQALEISPDYLPAILALADMAFQESRWDEAEALISSALGRLAEQDRDEVAETAATLAHRLSLVHEQRDALEEGLGTLQDLNRRYPNQFKIRLAIGQNRFLARRWREAVRFLGSLSDHPDAERYPDETASALCRAAEAEIKQKRPAKAKLLWEQALAIKPDHLGAINALVDTYTEQGNFEKASGYLQAQADATNDPDTKVRLLDALGDLHQEQLEDDGAALRCYRQALQAAEPIEARHLPILEKIFPLCRAEGDDAEAARIIGFILAFTDDPERRLPREIQAADAFVALGDVVRAEEHLARALEIEPGNEQATVALVDLYEQTSRAKELAEVLSSYLGRLPEASEESEWRRRAALYEKLAATYQHGLEDPRGAIEALEKALALDPTRLSCREILGELYGTAPEYADRAFLNNLALVAADVRRPKALRLLARVYDARGEVDKALCTYRVLDAFGEADLDELGYIAQHAPPELGAEERPPGVLREEDHDELLGHPDTRVMRDVFSTLWEGAPALFGQGLEALGISAEDRVSPVADMDLARVYGAAARVLANRHTGLYLNWDGDSSGVHIACHAPPVIICGSDIEERPLGELRFRLGRALELTRPEYILAAGLEPPEFNSLFAAVLRAFHPRHSRRRLDEDDPIAQRAVRLKKDLPYRVSRKMVELFQEKAHVEFNSAAWRQAVQHCGNRAGLVVSGDLTAAVRVLLAEELQEETEQWSKDRFAAWLDRSESLRELCSYACSEEYFSARRQLGLSVRVGGDPDVVDED